MSKKKTVKRQTSKQVRRNLSQRMKTGKLYVVFTGIDHEVISVVTYNDPARTPRIYSKTTLDPRVSEQLPICRSIETAKKCLVPEIYAVVLPLSAVIEYCGEYEVRRWASPQRSVSATEVREYVSKKVAKDGTTRDRNIYIKEIADNHSRWISNNPEGTLADLLDFLECARFDFLRYDGDELIADHFEDLRNASDYLLDFGDPSEPVYGEELPTFEYRLEIVDEDIMTLDGYIEFVGESFKLADLPSREQSTPSPLELVA